MRKLDSLTTLRFFAAAMIVVHHSTDHFGIPHDVAWRFNLGQAVGFFFVLSGFILTYVYPTLDTWESRGALAGAHCADLARASGGVRIAVAASQKPGAISDGE